MRKKLLNNFILGVALISCASVTTYADNTQTTINLDDSTVYYLQSDGRNNSTRSQSGETTNKTSSNNSVQETQEQKNARESRSSVVATLNEWKNHVKNSDSYGKCFFYAAGQDAVNLAFSSVRTDKVKVLIQAVKQLKKDINNGAPEYNNNSIAKIGSDTISSDYDSMSNKEKNQIKQEIVKQNHSTAIIQNNATVTIYENDLEYIVQDSDAGLILNNPVYDDDISKQLYFNPGTLVRRDIFKGYPPMNDMENDYTSRFNGLIAKANDNGWNDNTSVYMNDSITVCLLTDYHVYSAKKDYITHTSFLNNERRWTITLNGNPIGEPVITDDPRHQLNFTNVYKKYGAGEYHIVAEQLADVQRATFVQYEIGEYLFETDTGNILWFNESRICGNGGGSIFLNAITTQEWVETEDTFDITINDLGEIEKDGSATQREE